MKKFVKKSWKGLFVYVVLSLFYAEPSLALTISDAGNNLINTSKIIANAGKYLGGMVGFILVLVGVNGIIQAKKQQQGLGLPVATLLVGAGLLSAVAVSGIATSTFTGSDSNSTSELLQ
jgi:hypothetical protein